jgi:hypothetical protein
MSVPDGNYKVQFSLYKTIYWLGLIGPNIGVTETDTNYIFYVKTDSTGRQRIFSLLPSGLPGELTITVEEIFQVVITDLNLSDPPNNYQLSFQPNNIKDNYNTYYTVNCPPNGSPLISGGSEQCDPAKDPISWTISPVSLSSHTISSGTYVFKNSSGFLSIGSIENTIVIKLRSDFDSVSCSWTFDGTNLYGVCGYNALVFYLAVDSSGINIYITTDQTKAAKIQLGLNQIIINNQTAVSIANGVNNNLAYGFSVYFPQSQFTIYPYSASVSDLPSGSYTIAYGGKYVNKVANQYGQGYSIVFNDTPMSWIYDSVAKTLKDKDTGLCWFANENICSLYPENMGDCDNALAARFSLTSDGQLFDTKYNACYQVATTSMERYTNFDIQPVICDNKKWTFIKKQDRPSKSSSTNLWIILVVIILLIIIILYFWFKQRSMK